MTETKALQTQHNQEVISIEEFVERLPEWNFDKYIEKIPTGQGKDKASMIGVQGANFIASKCGISITAVEVIDETDEYITVMAAAQYRERTDFGCKRQDKKGSRAPFEMAVSKARRKGICNMVPEKEIIARLSSDDFSDSKYIKAAKAIESAELKARSAASEVAPKLKEFGTNVEAVSKSAQDENGSDTSIWGINDWKRFEDMLRNPDKWHLLEGETKTDKDSSDSTELDMTDATEEADILDETTDDSEDLVI